MKYSDDIKRYLLKIMVFIFLIVGMAYFPYIPMKLFNFDITSFSNLVRIIYLVCCDIGFMIIIYAGYYKTINKNFKQYIKSFKENFDIAFKYYFIGLIIMVVSNLIISIFFSSATAGNEETVRNYIDNFPLYMIFSVSIYAPFVEEIIFRKGIKDIVLVNKKNTFKKYLYILISGLVFAGMHIIGNVNSPIDWLYIIPYAALGISFAALYYKTDNIFSSISMHALHNTITIILYLTIGGI